MASWLIRIASSPGKSSRSRREICCGLHALAQRRCCRRPWRRPFQVTAGPATAAPPGATTAPANRSRTYARSAGFVASLAGFGRRAARSACHWAVVARYSRPPPRVAALRRSSRETVDAARPSRRATSRTPWPCARHSATSSRSANDRYRPEGGLDDRASVDGGMPPASRNQRTPTAGDTPTSTAASSLDCPAAVAVQNRRRSSRRATPGRPGERDTPRPDRSERRLRVPIANPSVEVLRRPLESALDPAIGVLDQPAGRLPALDRHHEGVAGELAAEVVGHAPPDDLAGGHVLDGGQVQPALPGRDVGDVREPDRVRPVGGEVPAEQVRRHGMVMPAVGRARDAAPARGRQAASAHEPRHPPAADPDAVLAQLGVDAGAAVGPPARLEDRGDPSGEAGILARAAAGPAAQPGVEAARRDAHEPAQAPPREGRALGGDEAVPHVGTASRAKKAAARSRISFSCSSRLFSRFSRASSAASAFCRARASAEPAARRSLRHVLSWLAWTPSSAAPCCRALPLSSSRLTASALYSAVNRRRLRSCAIVRSRCWWNLPYEGVHPARAGSAGVAGGHGHGCPSGGAGC